MKSTLYFVFLGVVLILFFFSVEIAQNEAFLGHTCWPRKGARNLLHRGNRRRCRAQNCLQSWGGSYSELGRLEAGGGAGIAEVDAQAPRGRLSACVRMKRNTFFQRAVAAWLRLFFRRARTKASTDPSSKPRLSLASFASPQLFHRRKLRSTAVQPADCSAIGVLQRNTGDSFGGG